MEKESVKKEIECEVGGEWRRRGKCSWSEECMGEIVKWGCLEWKECGAGG